VIQTLTTVQHWVDRHPRTLRPIRHTLLWLIVWGGAVAVVHFVFRDTLLVNVCVMLLLAVPPIGYFYLLGYVVLPRFLFRFHPLYLLGCLVLIYWVSYVLNRAILLSLSPYTISSASYLTKITALLRPAGWFGCFTTVKIALWHSVFGWLLMPLMLVSKTLKDISAFRNQTSRLRGDKLRLERDQVALERGQLVLELDLLKTQVSPHFLFNTLNTVYDRVIDADPQAAAQVLRLSELMRYNLYEASTECIALSRELTYVDDYVQLEQARHTQWVTVTLTVDEQTERYQIAPLLLIPFVENAFKHGISAEQSSVIRVAACIEDETFVFTVHNNLLLNRLPTTGRKSGGLGLVNVRKRLDLLYAGRYTLEAGPLADQYVVTLRLVLDRLPTTAQSLHVHGS
jgi:two-component system, LytTR family, sensor kinase